MLPGNVVKNAHVSPGLLSDGVQDDSQPLSAASGQDPVPVVHVHDQEELPPRLDVKKVTVESLKTSRGDDSQRPQMTVTNDPMTVFTGIMKGGPGHLLLKSPPGVVEAEKSKVADSVGDATYTNVDLNDDDHIYETPS